MKKLLLIFCILLCAGLLCCCSKKSDKESASTPEVSVAEAFTDSIVLHKDYPGYLKAATRADVVGEVSGRLLSRNFEPGAYVHKGQVLFTIESTTYRDAVTEAQASLQSAQSQHEYYSAQTVAMEKAFAQQAVSKMELLQSQQSLKQADASIRTARAQLENASTMLAKCTVRAPISGYISQNTLSVGNYINGEGNPQTLATIYDNSLFDAIFSIEDSQYGKLLGEQNGSGAALYKSMPLSFSSPLPHSYTADLYYEAPSVNESTGSLQLTGHVRNIDNELKDGMYVTVSLPYGTNPKAVMVKDASLSTDQLGKYLYVVNDSDKVVYTPVTVGPLYHDSLRVIEKGIKAGDRYVTEALLTVRPGMKVKPHLTGPATSSKSSDIQKSKNSSTK